ncbi:hypothetical protein CAC42_4411 [Sphaceloma murrayae]|uniref:ADP-ribose 1''-phosphate phosphatase n=1 Tax=Sphaceloma murrayae TaxID=2082308 RepID=A0A2K1QMB6_9PEZI|nr:hypothetical protein CAC42_4411 [Sphaceloma murrayae]
MGKRKREDEDAAVKTAPIRKSPRHHDANCKVVSEPKQSGHTNVKKSRSAPRAVQTREKDAETGSLPDHVSNKTFIVTEEAGDLFNAPPNTVLVHACNCRGYWGAGIAAVFKKRYPEAFKICNTHCTSSPKDSLPGTALLIPPQKSDKGKHFVGNLFTSRSIGKSKDPKAVILNNTGPAMEDLLKQIADFNKGKGDGKIKRIWLCKINSGIFGVPWEKTREVLESVEVPDGDCPLEALVVVHD